MAGFICKQCGRRSEKWAKLCFFCETPSLYEDGPGQLQTVCAPGDTRSVRAGDVVTTDEPKRFRTPFQNLNGALEGGFASESVVQIAGPPGSGKSTLSLQFLDPYAKKSLFVAVEETAADVVRRMRRLRMQHVNDLSLFCNVDHPERIQEEILEVDPDIVVIDSVSKLRWSAHDYEGPPLEAEMVRAMAHFAKKRQEHADRAGKAFLLILISHVLKSGDIAGMKSVEHEVDMTLKMHMNTLPDDGEIQINPKPFTPEQLLQRAIFLKLRTVNVKKTRSGGAPPVSPTFLLEADGLHEYPAR